MKKLTIKDLEFTPIPHGRLLLWQDEFQFTEKGDGIGLNVYSLSIKGQDPEEEDMDEDRKAKMLYAMFAICMGVGMIMGIAFILILQHL